MSQHFIYYTIIFRCSCNAFLRYYDDLVHLPRDVIDFLWLVHSEKRTSCLHYLYKSFFFGNMRQDRPRFNPCRVYESAPVGKDETREWYDLHVSRNVFPSFLNRLPSANLPPLVSLPKCQGESGMHIVYYSSSNLSSCRPFSSSASAHTWISHHNLHRSPQPLKLWSSLPAPVDVRHIRSKARGNVSHT